MRNLQPAVPANQDFTLPGADFGSGQALQSAVVEGLYRGVGGTTARAGKYLLTRTYGSSPLTEDVYKRDYKGIFKYDKAMTVEEAELRREDWIDDELRAVDMGHHSTASMIGTLVGGIANPVDLALFSVVPEFKVATWASQTGLRGEALLASKAARWSMGQATENMTNASINAGMQAIALEPFMLQADLFSGRQHDLSDSAMNVASGFGLGLVGGLGKTAWHAYKPDLRQRLARAGLRSGMFGETSSPLVDALASMDPNVVEATNLARQAGGEMLRSMEPPEDVSGMSDPARPDQTGYDTRQATEAAHKLRAHVTKTEAFRNTAEGVRTKRALQDKLNESARLLREKARVGSSDDEVLLDVVFKRLFGTEVRYVDNAAAMEHGLMGLFDPRDPGRIYIRTGELFEGPSSMLRIAGHEMGHVIRMRDPNLWLSMTDAMLDIHGNKYFAESWKEVRNALGATVHETRTGAKVKAWQLQSYYAKMDEVFATVLGHAMQTPDFWIALNKHGNKFGETRAWQKLAGYLQKTHDIVRNSIMVSDQEGRKVGAKISRLESQLAKAMSAVNESGLYTFKEDKKELVPFWERALNENGLPQGPDKKRTIIDGYYERKPKFRQLEKELIYDRINRAGLRSERVAEWQNRSFSSIFAEEGQEGSLRDKSASPNTKNTKLLRTEIRKLNDGTNPVYYLVKSFYGGLRSAEAKKAFDTLVNKRAQEYKKNGSFSQTAFEQGPLATYRRIGSETLADGRTVHEYEFKIYSNDDAPSWSENRLGDDIDPTQAQFKANYEELASVFSETAEKLSETDKKVPERLAAWKLSQEFRDSTTRKFLERYSLTELASMDAQAKVDAFYSFLNEEMGVALAERDQRRYANLRDIYTEDSRIAVNPDTESARPKTLVERVSEVKFLARTAFDLNNSGVNFEQVPELWAQKYRTGADWRTRTLLTSGDAFDGGVGEAFDVTRSAMFREFMDKMEQDNPTLFFIYGNSSEGRQRGIEADILRAVDQAIFDNYPNLRRALDDKFLDRKIGKIRDVIEEHGHFDRTDDKIATHDSFLYYDPPVPMRMTPEEALRMATQTAKDARSDSDAAHARALANLKDRHERYIGWLKDSPAEAKKQLKDLLKRNNLIDFDPEDKPPVQLEHGGKATEVVQPPERTHAEEALHDRLKALKRGNRAALKDLANIYAQRQRERGDKAPETDYTMDRFMYHLRQSSDRWQAAKAAETDINNFYIHRMRESVLAHEGSKRVMSKMGKSIKTLFSWLDGHFREGVTDHDVSIDALRHGQVEEDLSAFHQTVARFGLGESWQKNELTQMIMGYLETGDQSMHPAIRSIGDVLRQTIDMQAGRINAHGGAYRLLEGYSLSTVHDPVRISADKAGWTRFLLDHVDWERTGDINGRLDTEQARLGYIESVFKVLIDVKDDPNFDIETMGGNVLNESSMRRTIHFKPAKDSKAFQYDMLYGSGDTGGEIIAQIMRRGERSAIISQLGPTYKKTWSDAMTSMGIQFKTSFDELARANSTFQQLVGTWDNPVNVSLARKGRALRNYANSVSLWFSGISSITDYANVTSSLRYAGVPLKDLHSRIVASMKETARTPEGRRALEGMGSGMQAVVNSYSRLTTGTFFELASQKLSDMTFKYSGTELTTRMFQDAMHDILTQHLGDMAKGKHTAEFTTWLKNYGLENDFAAMAKHAARVDGLEGVRLSPDLIPDERLSLLLRGAIRDTVGYGQLQPSVSNEALLRMGTRAGTWSGEAMRLIGQYKGYPLAVVTKVNGRFNHGYGNVEAPFLGIIPRGIGRKEKLAWMAGIFTLALVAVNIKDVLRGHEPMNPFERDHWTWDNLSRVVVQGGFGPVAIMEQFSSPGQALGPVPGMAWKAGSAVARSDEPGALYRNTEAVAGALPFASIGFLNEARKTLLGHALGDGYSTFLEMGRGMRHESTGQEDLFDFGTKHDRR